MDLVGEILPVLVGLYVVDSALIVRAGQVLFVSGWGGVLAALGPGLRFPGLLPAAEVVLGASLPLRACEDGVIVPGPGASARLVPFDSMPPVVAEAGVLRLGGGVRLPVRPQGLAPELARIVERLRLTARPRRLARLRRELRRRTDARALAALRARHVRGLPLLRALGWASGALLFLALPASFLPDLPLRPTTLAVAAAALLLWLGTLAASARLLLDCGVAGRGLLAALLPLLLFPPAAVHAASLVTRELYLGFEPEALARLLLTPQALDAYRRDVQPPADDAEPWSVPSIVRGLLARGAAGAVPVPRRHDATAGAFCPRCRGEYRAGFSRCSDCGVPLEPFY